MNSLSLFIIEMNLWDLNSISAIFNTSSSKSSYQSARCRRGFCVCQSRDTPFHEISQGDSSGVQLYSVQNFDYRFPFDDLAEKKPKKLSTILTQQEDQSCLKSYSKMLSCKKRERQNSRNLKSIASSVYQYLKKHESCCIQELMNLFFDCLGNTSYQKEEGKNIRRRLYDVINVIDALKVLKKSKNQILFNANNASPAQQKQQLKQKMHQINQSMSCKRKIVQKLKKILTSVQFLTKRNQNHQNIAKKIMFPLSFYNKDKSASLLKENNEKVTIFYPNSQIQLFSQFEMIQQLMKQEKINNEK